jgi:integrase
VSRQQLPPQIKKVTLKARDGGKPVIRYQLTVDTGVDEHGKRHQTRRRFATEKEARAELVRISGDVTAGSYARPGKETVETACEEWLASKHSLKPSTLAGHASKLAMLRRELGDVELAKLKKKDLDLLVGRLRQQDGKRKPWSARSINYLLYLTQAVLAEQVTLKRISINIAALVDRVPGEPKAKRTLTEDEIAQVLDHGCRDQHLWTLAIYGLRRGEVSGLHWRNVNLTDEPIGEGDQQLPPKHLRVAENRVAIGKRIETGTPKSKASRRTLPLPDDVVAVLKAARKRQVEERLAAGPRYVDTGYVAVDEFGKPYHPNLLTFRWGKLLKDLKIPAARLHDARHTCATVMHHRGVPIAVIAAWLGHASAAFTMAVYAHSTDPGLAAAATSLRPVVTTRDNRDELTK